MYLRSNAKICASRFQCFSSKVVFSHTVVFLAHFTSVAYRRAERIGLCFRFCYSVRCNIHVGLYSFSKYMLFR